MLDNSNKKDIILKNINNWKTKLLDLSTKNKTINFSMKETKTVPSQLEILIPNFNNFISTILDSNKQDFDIVNYKNKQINSKDVKNFYSFRVESINEIEKRNQIMQGKIYGEFGGEYVNLVLDKIYKNYKKFQEEYSIDILFLTFGLLEWYDSPYTDEKKFAPLLFIPVDLKKVGNNWTLVIKKENILAQNDALVMKFKKEFSININIDSDVLEGKGNVQSILEQFNNLILDNIEDKRWKIHNRIFLSNFDFSNIHTYKDLSENTNNVIHSPFCQHIMGESNSLDTDIRTINEKNINEKISIEDDFKILDADSSQEIAIKQAVAGKSFILQGPPGTGKSQTITNIITELISRGKKVLFLAAKRTALDVVYNNLKKVNLDKFAIPIYDLAVNKKEIINEIIQISNETSHNLLSETNLKNFITNHNQVQEILEKYGSILTKPFGPESLNLYNYIGKFAELESVLDLNFEIEDNPLKMSNSKFEDILNTIDRFFQSYQAINFDWKKHQWLGLNVVDINEKEEIFNNLENILEIASQTKQQIIDLGLQRNRVVIETNFITSIFAIYQLVNFYNSLKFQQDFDSNIDVNEILTQVKELNNITKTRQQLVSELLQTWTNVEFLEQKNARDVYETVINKSNSSFKFLSGAWKEVSRLFKSNLKENLDLKNINLIQQSEKFVNLEDHNKSIDKLVKQLPFEVDLKDLERVEQGFEQITNAMEELEIHHSIFKLLSMSYHNSRILNFLEKFVPRIQLLMSKFDKSLLNFENISFESFNNKVKGFIQFTSQFDDYVRFNFYKNSLQNLNCNNFLEAILKSNFTIDFRKIYLKQFYKKLVEHTIKTEIPYYDSIFLNNNLNLFRTRDQEIIKNNIDKIAFNLDKNIKEFLASANSNPQYMQLKKEAAKQTSKISFRQLFANSLDFILNIKPCLMLSPLVVSWLFKNLDFKFDVIIFDEASQIRPEIAITSLYRGKQVIIAGDKEQMPPSNFFVSNYEDDENGFDEDNLSAEDDFSNGFDSVLNLGEAILDSIELKWHYRSEFEELIYTSKENIYKSLKTFANARQPQSNEGLRFVYAQPDLATKISDEQNIINKSFEILKKLINKYHNKASIGFVVLNSEVQQKVEREIEKFKLNNPKYKFFFESQTDSPFFVKNIETVQGDERDFIIFLIEGKRNSDSRIGLSFGAINRNFGYKRLNVAITRAKKGMFLVSNFRSDEVDWFKSDNRGIKLLEQFFKNAEFGIKPAENTTADKTNSIFANQVYLKLKEKGFNVHKQVGSSSQYIDIAVVDSKNSNHYVLGIECDGTAYKQSKTSRDRDRLRHQVFQRRGWNIHRIWSVDWFKNSEEQLQIIVDKLINLGTYPDKSNNNSGIKSSNDDNYALRDFSSANLFEEFPDIEEIVSEFANKDDANSFYQADSEQKSLIIKQVLDKSGPILYSKLATIIKNWIFEPRINPSLKDKINNWIFPVAKIQDNFVIPLNADFKFRQSKTLATQRNILEIHDNELKNCILTIFEHNNIAISLSEMTREICNRTQNNFRATFSQKIKEIFEQLKDDDKVIEVSFEIYRKLN